MPHRRLVNIGVTTPLPTISQFLNEMAIRQHEEIERLKREAQTGTLPDPTVPEEDHQTLTPDAWQLHPVRVKKAPKKKAKGRPSAKAKPRGKTSKKAAKRSAKKATARKPAKSKKKKAAAKKR